MRIPALDKPSILKNAIGRLIRVILESLTHLVEWANVNFAPLDQYYVTLFLLRLLMFDGGDKWW